MSEGIRSFRATVKIAAKRRLSISEEKRNHSKSNKLNLLSHGDFENPVIYEKLLKIIKHSPVPVGQWQKYHGDEHLTIDSDGLVSMSGDQALRVEFFGTALKLKTHHLRTRINLEPGHTYEFSYTQRSQWITSGTAPFFEVFYDLNGRAVVLTSTQKFRPSGTTDWGRVSVQFKLPENQTSIIVRMRIEPEREHEPPRGIFWADDMQLIKI